MKNRLYYLIAGIAALLLLVLTYVLQPYQLTSLEESYIMLYDSDYVWAVVSEPGGFAQILASLCTQFFMIRWLAPVIVTLIYAVVIFSLTSVAVRLKATLWAASLAALPCLCLMLCLENYSFEFQGTTAMMLCALAFCGYAAVALRVKPMVRVVSGCLMAIAVYFLAGEAALSFGVAAALFDIVMRAKQWYLSLLYPMIILCVAYISYCCGVLATAEHVYAPVMYYDMGSTYFMMIYALSSLPIYALIVTIMRGSEVSRSRWRPVVWALVVLAVEVGAMLYVYNIIHSVSNSQNNRERYLARNGQWQAIADIHYDGSQTPYTSYRFLALAHLGKLAERVGEYRPFISYIFENKPKVKKRDQQVYSDIYFDCNYMAAARHSAFDTDIVTPGAFNPYETQKLVDINLAFGDYAVAEKLISKLEKTLFYRSWASDRRALLYDDAAVEADPLLGRMRRAIPAHNDYLSPKGIGRDLKYIVDHDPDQQVASEFYNAFLILTNQY